MFGFKKEEKRRSYRRKERKKKPVRTGSKQSIAKKHFKMFEGAEVNRLTADWNISSTDINEEIRLGLARMRSRSRDLVHNNDYAKKYISMFKTNVVGSTGFTLQARSRDSNQKLDEQANKLIEKAWKEWNKPANCSVQRNLSFLDIQNVYGETLPRDGEFLLRIVKNFNNDFRFAVQLIDIDLLDEDFDDIAPNKNIIQMGIEYDEWAAPVAYHLLKHHPGTHRFSTGTSQEHTRVDASEIIHIFQTHRAQQARGFPFMHSAMKGLRNIDKYMEAELVAARIAAAKMGFITSPTGTEYEGDDREEDGTIISEAEPGHFEQLADGQDFKPFLPEHPSGTFEPFVKTNLRSTASGLNVAYNSLANDLQGVNFSSMRSGALEERDNWKVIQTFTRTHLLDRIFDEWLPFALLTQKLKLPDNKIEKFSEHWFQARAFDWIDPLKDVKAKTSEVENGLISRTQIAGERGRDIKEVFEDLKKENEMAEEMGISISKPQADADAQIEINESNESNEDNDSNNNEE